jgi:Fe(3+) dicitrate transport protein
LTPSSNLIGRLAAAAAGLVAWGSLCLPVHAQADDEHENRDGGELIEIIDSTPPGAAHVIGAKELERFERDDIHKVLAAVPGVYIREEDGYGLRPNIGMRGTGSERSSKIALMEDGVLIAPAPYSAPAAYYFPMVTRMTAVEVLKGPASIRFGPNTVGGAINLLGRPIPRDRTVYLDVAGGSDFYGKGNAYYGESTDRFGWLFEAAKLRADGFKEIDGPGQTGFDKHDASVRLRANSRTFGRSYHQLDLHAGYADELSHETYTGLTDADFAVTPYRRYAGTQLDRMDWTHWQTRLTYRLALADTLNLTVQAYRHTFSRAWRKLNRFNTSDRDLRDILANPTTGSNAVFYSVLTGAADSSSPAETLLIGTNDRQFLSQGIQAIGHAERRWLGWNHSLELGTRVHFDRAHRFHYEDGHVMMGGRLQPAGIDRIIDLHAADSTTAWASHYQHKLAAGPVTITGGARTEVIATRHRDLRMPGNTHDEVYAVLLPGAGIVYQPFSSLGLVAGVHRGFAPPSPSQLNDVDPEFSISYEAGTRYAARATAIEVIGFFNDYRNLIGSCSFSSGCEMSQVDDEFNGGKVHSYGAEVSAAQELAIAGVRLPLALGYTWQRSVFQQSFASSNPLWGRVAAGDDMPYLPNHQLYAAASASAGPWELAAAGRYTSSMRDVAGTDQQAEDTMTDSALVLDLAAHYRTRRWGELYLTVDNVLDEVHISSRRPFGARPGVPRLIVLGYKRSL